MPGLSPRAVSKANQPPHRNRKTGQKLENRQQVCPVCFENFNSTEAGDAHRKFYEGANPYCIDPDSAGLIPIQNRFGTSVWRLPNDS